MRLLRSNTATRVTVGPFFDATDGVTPETGLTATNEQLTLMVDTGGVPTLVLDATATASGGDNDLVHVTNDDAGFYDLELTAAQTNYLGRAMLAITYATDHCPVFHEFMIVTAEVYDKLCGTGALTVDVTLWKGAAAPDIATETDIADAILDRDMSTGADSGSPTVRTVRQALRFLRNKWAIVTGTLTVYKENDTTASWTATVGTTEGADPVTSNDPADS